MQTPDVVTTAQSKVRDDDKGGFPKQELQPPGLTSEMKPLPDHGEESWKGRGRLEGMKALITGGDSGIGRAVAIAYAREGADVAIGYLAGEESDAQEVAELVRAEGRKAALLPGDLMDREFCKQIVAKGHSDLGGLDILVNNAGYHWARGEEGLMGLDPDQMERTLRTNLHAIFWLCKAAAPLMKPGSSIINTSSVQAYDPSVSLLDYAATKAAVNNLTVGLAADLGPQGIRVNAVAPGPIWTPLQPATKKGELMETLGADVPLGRAGQPSELAGAYVFLASPEEASYVSGTVIGVTGGKPVF